MSLNGTCKRYLLELGFKSGRFLSTKCAVDCIVSRHNDHRRHSSQGYVATCETLEGEQKTIHNERNRKLEQAREELARKRAVPRNMRHLDGARPRGKGKTVLQLER